jgi:hypothetical protein
MICREDGRCAYPSFLAVYSITENNATVTMGGHTSDKSATIDWGDGTIESIPTTTKNDLSHTYAKGGKDIKYKVVIKGDYRDWSAGCDPVAGVDLYDVKQFGPIGLGWHGNPRREGVDQGSFTNCTNLEKMTAKDIPDSTKLTNMDSMFGGNNGNPGYTFFNAPNSVSRWDTSNVTSMYHTFINAGDGDHGENYYRAFNQDIGRWNVSKVKDMEGMFLGAIRFNQDISCWNMSKVENISEMFFMANDFNQNLSKWNLTNLPANGHNFTFRCENGHNGDISLKNYCILRERVDGENLGRDGGASEDPCRARPAPFNYGSACCAAQCHRDTSAGLCNGYEDEFCGTNAAGLYGYDYGKTCDADPKTGQPRYIALVNNCLSKYLSKTKEFSHLTEDTVTCHHIRVCRGCAWKCYVCKHTEGCDMSNVKNITDEEIEKQKEETGHYDVQIDCECEHFDIQ